MYRHVSLRRRNADGRPTWLLLGPDGLPINAFTAFAESLRNAATNTRESYLRHVAEFIDYLIEAIACLGQGQLLTKLQLTEVLEAYGQYLLLGVDSSDQIAKAVAVRRPPGRNKPSSIVPKKAALRRFLRCSEDVRREMTELGALFGRDCLVASDTLVTGIGERRQLSSFEVGAMQQHSMLAGVIVGGPKLIDCVPLGQEGYQEHYDERRAFPYDKVMDLIDAMPTYRDKSYYSLLAASGCRGHEGRQVFLNDDIDVEKGTVRLVDPKSRGGHRSYRFLTPAQREQLAWKGRTSDLTLLIEPFATAFFESLQLYLEREYVAHGKHDFLFQYVTGAKRGLPYFLSTSTTRRELFERICKRIGVELPDGSGGHSLRHMYGTYLLNYFPRSNGDYGLPLPMVQQLLGHSDVKHTQKYAKFDKDITKHEIEHANRVLYRHGTPKKLLELKLEALEAQMKKVRLQLSQEADVRA